MKRRIDSKYEINVVGHNCECHNEYCESQPAIVQIRNVYNGNIIPEDEPLFIFRAKDKYALDRLREYYCVCQNAGCTTEQLEGILGMIQEFEKWQHNNPDKMKQPGSTMPEDMRKLHKENEIDPGDPRYTETY